jgi:hypothetical protein
MPVPAGRRVADAPAVAVPALFAAIAPPLEVLDQKF